MLQEPHDDRIDFEDFQYLDEMSVWNGRNSRCIPRLGSAGRILSDYGCVDDGHVFVAMRVFIPIFLLFFKDVILLAVSRHFCGFKHFEPTWPVF